MPNQLPPESINGSKVGKIWQVIQKTIDNETPILNPADIPNAIDYLHKQKLVDGPFLFSTNN